MKLVRHVMDLARGNRVLCPYCMHEFKPAEGLWVSEHPSLRSDSVLGPGHQMRFSPNEIKRTAERRPIDPLGGELSLRACPQRRCRRVIPTEMFRRRSRVLTVVGFAGVGKSTLIASMLHTSRSQLDRMGIGITPLEVDTNSVWRLIPNVFEKAGTSEAVMIERSYDTPLFVSVTQADSGGVLVIHEVDLGESMLSTGDGAALRHRIAKSDAVMCVIDPLQSTVVRASIARELELAGVPRESWDPSLVAPLSHSDTLNATGTVLSSLRSRSGGGLLGSVLPPIAVTLTKMDVWGEVLSRMPVQSERTPVRRSVVHRMMSTVASRIAGVGGVDQRAQAIVRSIAPGIGGVIDQNFLVREYFCTQALGVGGSLTKGPNEETISVIPSRLQPFGGDSLFGWLLGRLFPAFENNIAHGQSA